MFKLQLFGVPHMGFVASKAVGWMYTVVAAHSRPAWRLTRSQRLRAAHLDHDPRSSRPCGVRFCRRYAPFPSTLVGHAPGGAHLGTIPRLDGGRGRLGVLAFTFGTGGAPPRVNAIWTLAHTVAAFVLVAIVFRMAGTLQSRAANHCLAPPPWAGETGESRTRGKSLDAEQRPVTTPPSDPTATSWPTRSRDRRHPW